VKSSRSPTRAPLPTLDLAKKSNTLLAETRSVGDQVEWLDDDRLLYGLDD
jgi:hypothetical protein